MTEELAVVIPTRTRPHNMERMVEAWRDTGAFGVADMYMVWDLDDMRAPEYKRLAERTPEIRPWVCSEWKPLVPKLNEVAVDLAGQYRNVAFMGDDHLPRTPLWAHMLLEDHMTKQPRKLIWYGQDGFHNDLLPTWWSMDSRVIQTLGRMVPAGVQHLYCDNSILELGKAADTLGYDRRILIEHMHPVLEKAKPDAQYERVNRPEQYARDKVAFVAWRDEAKQRDATLISSIGR